MLDLKLHQNADSGKKWIETSLAGKPLLTTPQLNKGTAFTLEERIAFNLMGKLPCRIESLDEQVKRAYKQFSTYQDKLEQNIYLNSLLDTNQTLFYKLVSEHLAEMIPTIYTPIVGTAVKEFSQEYRHPRGIYLSYPEKDHMSQILDNRSHPEIDLIVVTDGEGVLGIGDQGIGGMDIPIAKLMVYTLCAGIDPMRTLPIILDVGTNNEKLLKDPLYLGWRHPRLSGQQYDEFIANFVDLVKQKFPDIFLHWEDFGRDNARRNLEKYQSKLCTFNDDMQGTGAVTLAALLAAVNANNSQLTEQKIVVFGAGTAGTGIVDQICTAMVKQGLSPEAARKRFWLLDRPGLLTDDMPDLTTFQKPYAQSKASISHWQLADPSQIQLSDVIKHVKPTVLIGSSAVTGAFTQELIQEMAQYTSRPIIFPLSNPTERCEAHPKNILEWTDGKALIATGSPFEPIDYQGQTITIAQCNNALVFPGLGLGLISTKAKRLSDDVLWITCQALSECAPITKNPMAPLLPSLDEARLVAEKIAIAVAKQVVNEGNADTIPIKPLPDVIKNAMWEPQYIDYVRK